MKKTHFLFIAFAVLFIATTAAINPTESTSLYEKVVIVELDIDQDSVLFKPNSKAWSEQWTYNADVTIDGSDLMNCDKYKFSFKERKDNLWTILHPMIIDGTIQSYLPSDPDVFGFGPKDDGELRFPILDKAAQETFVNSAEIREIYAFALGSFGPMSDFPLSTEFGEDSIIISEDGMVNYVYAPREYWWYKDEDIIQYKVRVRILLNKKGVEKKRIIESICPVVHQRNEAYEIVGEKELLWFDFKELEPVLKEAYFFQENWKPKSYLTYILEKVNGMDVKK